MKPCANADHTATLLPNMDENTSNVELMQKPLHSNNSPRRKRASLKRQRTVDTILLDFDLTMSTFD